MSSYLITNYKGKYSLQAEIDKRTGDFCRDEQGNLENYTDVWIDCNGKGKVFHFGGNKLQFYMPSLGRGHNIIKAICENRFDSCKKYITTTVYKDSKTEEEKETKTYDYESMYEDLTKNGIVFDIEETDEEILFKFKSSNMNELESFIKPKTHCADRSPYSTSNLRKHKEKYAIPLQELEEYKAISAQISKDDISIYNRINKGFIDVLSKKMRTNSDDLKYKIRISGKSTKEYIHSLGNKTWVEYLDYMQNHIKGEI